ncbi:MAG: hypothetical protein AAF581_01725 [Planctomycetota bacterium]
MHATWIKLLAPLLLSATSGCTVAMWDGYAKLRQTEKTATVTIDQLWDVGDGSWAVRATEVPIAASCAIAAQSRTSQLWLHLTPCDETSQSVLAQALHEPRLDVESVRLSLQGTLADRPVATLSSAGRIARAAGNRTGPNALAQLDRALQAKLECRRYSRKWKAHDAVVVTEVTGPAPDWTQVPLRNARSRLVVEYTQPSRQTVLGFVWRAAMTPVTLVGDATLLGVVLCFLIAVADDDDDDKC